MRYALDGREPQLDEPDSVWIAPGAAVIGNVRLGAGVGIWFGAVLRGDTEPITIGARSNIQEHAMVHTDPGYPATVGEGCTIGHRAILHGCTIGENSLIGMGATVLNGAVIGANCLVGAGALITERKQFPDGSLIVGAPAKVVRALTDAEIDNLRKSATHYAANQRRFAKGLAALP
ncbi:MAG: gamma carbonic anhydrase family protein [Phyllobacteriaceae bacterium]|nr:gamma carbonic anhydrase family protein [Phyllobacteriaceae bacterium]